MNDSTTHNPTIEYRLDTYGDDLNDLMSAGGMLDKHVEDKIRAGDDLAVIEQMIDGINKLSRAKNGRKAKQLAPTYFKEYRARLVFMDSVSQDGRTCQNYLVRSAQLAEELLRFPNNLNLLGALSASDDVATIKARIWSAQPFDEWTRDLGLLLGMSGDEFNEKMAVGAKGYETYRAGRS